MTLITIRERTYVPTFRGRHNFVKSKVFLFLFERYLSNKPGITLKELSARTNSNYFCLGTLLAKWIRWGFVGYTTVHGGRTYHINKLGREWCDRWYYLMPLEAIFRELET